MVIFWICGHFPMSWHNKNTDIEYELISLWHDWKRVNPEFGAPSQWLFFIFKGFLYLLPK